MTRAECIRIERTELAQQVIEYFNEQADKKFRYNASGTIVKFTAKWSHQYGFAQYRGVIDYLVLRWKDDPKMDKYLRPATIFGPEKFPVYLDEARSNIRNERNKDRLQSFNSYIPVERGDEKLPSFESYNPYR